MKKRLPTKYPPEEVEYLLTIYNEKDKSTIPERYRWIRSLTPIEARDELLTRFQSIIASLVEVCLRGKYWSSYSKTFLRMFASKGKPLQSVATVLKKELSLYTREELYHTGRVAVLIAIEKCETNLASAIVYSFKDEITKLINKETKLYLLYEIDEEITQCPKAGAFENEIAFQLFLDSLNEDEWKIAQHLIDGKQVQDVPQSLKDKLTLYLEG